MSKKNVIKRYFENFEYLDILICTIVVLFFHLCYSLQIINPTNINWIMSVYHDWGQHYLGWAFYRNDPWTFPLGSIESYNYPVGTNIGFMDSIPLLGLLFKPFSSILPDDFQYLGIWLFICTYFVAFYTKKILQLYKVSNWIIILAVIIMIANPVLLFRSIHPALSAHFLILGSIYNYLRPSYGIPTKINRSQVFLFFIAATVNPYIMVMIFGFNVIVPFKHFWIEKTINLKQFITYPILSIVLFIVTWILLGMIEFNGETNVSAVEPFSNFSFNLNSFFDSYGYYSKLIPDLGRINPSQYEGFAYLGIGMMGLILFAIFYLIFVFSKTNLKSILFKKWGILLILCLGLFLFSITNVLSFGNKTLLTLPLPSIIEKLGFIFRASGRFVWPFYYLLFIGSIIILAKTKFLLKYKVGILLFVTIVQLYDIQELYTRWNLPKGTYKTPLQDDKWISVLKNFDDIIIYPSFDFNYSINYHNDYQDLDYLALKANKPISNGYVARANVAKGQRFSQELKRELNSGVISKKRLFITTNQHIDDFDVLLNNGKVDIQIMDKFVFIYPKTSKISSADFDNDAQSKAFLASIRSYYKELKPVKFEVFPSGLIDESKILTYFDSFEFKENRLTILGWAFNKETLNNKDDIIYISLSNDKTQIIKPLKIERRLDISQAYKKSLDNSGFNSILFLNDVERGSYSIGIVIKDKKGEYTFSKTDKIIEIK